MKMIEDMVDDSLRPISEPHPIFRAVVGCLQIADGFGGP